MRGSWSHFLAPPRTHAHQTLSEGCAFPVSTRGLCWSKAKVLGFFFPSLPTSSYAACNLTIRRAIPTRCKKATTSLWLCCVNFKYQKGTMLSFCIKERIYNQAPGENQCCGRVAQHNFFCTKKHWYRLGAKIFMKGTVPGIFSSCKVPHDLLFQQRLWILRLLLFLSPATQRTHFGPGLFPGHA